MGEGQKMRILAILVACVVLLGCSEICKRDIDRWSPSYKLEGIPIVGDASLEEECAILAVGRAIETIQSTEAKWKFLDPVERMGIIIVRDPNQKVPEMCRECLKIIRYSCEDKWKDYPKLFDTKPRVPGEGFSGLCEKHIYVSRVGDRAKFSTLIGLLAHEWGCHEAADLDHGEACTEITRKIRTLAVKYVAGMPECEGFSSRYLLKAIMDDPWIGDDGHN
jgi:hypothetical protein